MTVIKWNLDGVIGLVSSLCTSLVRTGEGKRAWSLADDARSALLELKKHLEANDGEVGPVAGVDEVPSEDGGHGEHRGRQPADSAPPIREAVDGQASAPTGVPVTPEATLCSDFVNAFKIASAKLDAHMERNANPEPVTGWKRCRRPWNPHMGRAVAISAGEFFGTCSIEEGAMSEAVHWVKPASEPDDVPTWDELWEVVEKPWVYLNRRGVRVVAYVSERGYVVEVTLHEGKEPGAVLLDPGEQWIKPRGAK